MRRFSHRSLRPLGLVSLALYIGACGDDDVQATSAGTSRGDSTDGSSSTRGTSADGTTEAESVGTMGHSGDASADGTTTAGMDTGSSDTGNGNDPGPPPDSFPGMGVGLCAPPGLVQYCYTGSPLTYNVGACGPGTQQCQALDLDVGEWGDCEGETLPSMDACDGIDNDCDGEVDEELGSTLCGIGLCEHEVDNCAGGEEQLCDPLEGATSEVCDGIDNDCDGDIDDGLGDEQITCGLGQCEHSVTACVDGQMGVCDPFAGATPEVCDDIDNDCDGAVDEGLGTLSCGCGDCDHTVPACINGFPQVCDPFEGASAEICDGDDNDCDCIVDEDQGMWTCGQNECEVSVPQCIGGVPQPQNTCMPIPGGPEICGDGIDNNCDGIEAPCVEPFLVGTDTVARPIEVIWAVDSSGSMEQEMATVEAEINAFAAMLEAAGSSTQLHLIADRGIGPFQICVTPPLGGPGCNDNPAEGFWQYDTNGVGESMVHSSNALGRIIQQYPTWFSRLQPYAYIAFIVTTDDNGDDPAWGLADGDNSEVDDCSSLAFIDDATTGNRCRAHGPDGLDYTSLAYDHAGYGGFTTFMLNVMPSYEASDDWSLYPIIGNTGTGVLTGADDIYEFNSCPSNREDGEEYVKLALYTNTLPAMLSICDTPWDFSALADAIIASIPNDLYVLQGSPPGTCLMIDPSTITVTVNGIPLAPADWTYDAASCTVRIVNNVPGVGDSVSIVYENF
ncbi:MopE-related protein [Paraliomyxa miuraensis]|uniref:MopE-related protein n=1 Tax=Paraliomyxa miuraensis TaxID=376150 RepID=UPI0022529A66|nr:MopE-related protein [Paraliomyxa miuraensis]MCX4241977.1 MopE-related protein [Paraliomyxa miuraensis]